MLISTKPDSKGKEAVLLRSRLLTEFRWTPLADIPVYSKTVGKTKLSAGEEQLGMLYSSPEPTDQFIYENVSFGTFLTIIANPDSALYHKDLNGHNNSWAYFGLVCNGLVRYAMNIRRRYSTKRWPTVPGMRKIADDACYTAEEIRLCDVLYAFGKGRSHVALITDILRDESGKICQIEVSEAIRPTCVRRQFDVDVFFETYKLFTLWRYDFVDSVPMPEESDSLALEGAPVALSAVAIDHGNKSNYRVNEDVVISVFQEGRNTIEISNGSDVIETVVLTGPGKLVRTFDRGYYLVRHTKTGDTAEFSVTMPNISYRVENGILTVNADPCDPDSRILYMDFRERSKHAGKASHEAHYNASCAPLSKLCELTEEEKQTGTFSRPIPDDAENFKVYFENCYGIWTHTMLSI